MTNGHNSGTYPYISVVVPMLNAGQYVESCAVALLEQRYPTDCYELIFVDNGSRDGSCDAVRRFPRIRLQSESKRGAYAARNRGIGEAHGSIVAFTDPDCAPAPDWLSNIAAVMEDPAVQIALGQVVSCDSGPLALLDAYWHERGEYIFSGTAPDLYYGYANNMAARRALFDTLGYFSEIPRGGDVLFVRRVVYNSGVEVVQYSPGMLTRHLEVAGIWSWLRKMFIYGRTIRSNVPAASNRPLSPAEQMEVFRRTVRRRGYSLGTSALLFTLLALGVTAHWFGRLMPRRV
jgi:glycosyltransferase involved in cell wall biosynthesis